MNRSISTLCVPAGIAAFALLTGCTVSTQTKEIVARADSTVQQVQGAIGNSEAGALELQRARDSLARAKAAVDDYNDKDAQRLAQQAELDAQLAVAKTQHATARKAADELQASIRTMRQEAQRTLDPVR